MPPRGKLRQQDSNPALRARLEAAREYLDSLRRTLATLRHRGEEDTFDYQQLSALSAETAEFVKQAWQQLNQAYVVPPDAVSNLIKAGNFKGAAEVMANVARDRIDKLSGSLEDLAALEQLKPVTQPPGTNLAALDPGPLIVDSYEPPPFYADFLAAHPAASLLAATDQLQGLIEAGDRGARAQLAILTAIVEYGDKLMSPLPDMRLRPPPGSPFLPVYDKVKTMLERFQYGAGKVNLLNPGRLNSLMQADRDSSIKAMVAGLQTQPLLKKDALTIATELRDAFETEMNSVFAQTNPEPRELREGIEEGFAAAGLTYSNSKANLLMNPHLDPARCIADLATLLKSDNPDASLEACLARATGIRQKINVFNQIILQEHAERLYTELGGNPAVFAAHTLSAGNMADATGVPLQAGNPPGTPDYIGLLNNDYEGRVIVDERQGASFISNNVDENGLVTYTARLVETVGQGLPTALYLQALKLDADQNYAEQPSVKVTIPAGAAAADEIVIEYHKEGDALQARLVTQPLPEGMSFAADQGLLNLGPRYTQGQPVALELKLKSRDPSGAWDDFAIVIAKTIAPQVSILVEDLFEPDTITCKAGRRLLTSEQLIMIAELLNQGTRVVFTSLTGAAAAGGQGGSVRLDLSHSLAWTEEGSSLDIAICVSAEPRPSPAYKSPQDPTGALGLAQDRSIACALAIVNDLQEDFPDDPWLLSQLQDVEDMLQLKLLQPRPAGSMGIA